MSIYRPKFKDPKTGKLRKGQTYWLNFTVGGQRYRESTNTSKHDLAIDIEKHRRTEIEAGLNGVPTSRAVKRDRLKHFGDVVDAFLEDYAVRHPKSATYAQYALSHAKKHLGALAIIEVGEAAIREYQTARLKEQAAAKSVNEEVAFILRLLGDRGMTIRLKLRQAKSLKLKVAPTPGKAFSNDDQEKMLAVALASTTAARLAMERAKRGEGPAKGDKQGGSPNIYPALVLALNAGMRDAEMRNLTWSQIDLEKRVLTVGKAKTVAGEGRTIPLNDTILSALAGHRLWYALAFGEPQPQWYVFPGGGRTPKDPTVAITTFKTAWGKVREKANVTGRWHDNRHTLITELAESGAGDGTIMEIAGHVSTQMLARYSHIRMEAKRNALVEVENRRETAKQKAKAKTKTEKETRVAAIVEGKSPEK